MGSFWIWWCLAILINSSLGLAQDRHFYKWEVEYMYWSPDCVEGVVMAINGQFPGPTIRARAGDTLHIELTNKLHTEGVVIHWHGITQVTLSRSYDGSFMKQSSPLLCSKSRLNP